MILHGWVLQLLMNLMLLYRSVTGADEIILNNAKAIATALQNAKHPVIISGISCYHEGVIKAAYDIAAALNLSEKKAGLCLCFTRSVTAWAWP